MHRFTGLLLTATLLAPAAAQTSASLVNLELAQTGAFVLAGTACGPFSCTPAFGTVHSAIGAELRVWGPPGRFFAVAGSALPAGCQALPGFGGQLLLVPPAITVAVGTFPTGPGNACGLVQAPPVPLAFSGQHAGLSVLFQAVTIVPVPGAQPAELSPGIRALVRS